MNTNLIYKTISDASLYFDQHTLEEIKKFIDTFLGDSWQINTKLNIFVCTAIVCQCKKIPAIHAPFSVPFGLNIQKVMKCCTQYSKDQFINLAIMISQKWPTCPNMFKHKLENLKLCLRIFKKYRSACKHLGEKLGIESNNNYQISSLFWLVYLLAKQKFNQSGSVEVIMVAVPLLVFQIYTSFLSFNSNIIEHIPEMIAKYLHLPDRSNQAVKDIISRYEKQFVRVINEIYSKRFLQCPSNFNVFMQKPFFVDKIIQDLSNKFSQNLYNSPQFSLDEVSFLDLKKDMAPEGIHQKFDKNNYIIKEKISFQNQKFSDMDITSPKRTLNARRALVTQQTPITMRMQNLAWIRSCIENLQEEQFQNIKKLYNQYNKNSFHNFCQSISQKLNDVIIQFSPSCKDIERRKTEIHKFFVYCVNIAISMYKEEAKKIFQLDAAVLSIYCLCTEIFNFVYQTFNGTYARYCEIFQINFINAFWPINWFGFYIRLPQAVDDHLYELQRKFLIKEIWKTDLGYQIISNHQKMVRITQLRMLQRMKQHIKCRIDQICRETTIGQKFLKKTFNMVLQLLQNKPEILKRNNLDQIIVCSITASLSLNQPSNKISLQKIFTYYSRSSMSYEQDKEQLRDYNDNELTIVQFYNEVFLKDVQQIMSKSPQSMNFLLTPKRVEYVQKWKQGGKNTPLIQKHREIEKVYIIRRDGMPKLTKQYQVNLAKNIVLERDRSEMVSQSDEEKDKQPKKQ